MKKTKSLNEKMISEAFGEPNETCESCGSMLEIDSQSCTNESCSKKQVAETRKRSKWLSEVKKLFLEIRDKVSEAELVQTWEDLFVEAGNVTVEELASWVNATESAVVGSLPSWLAIDQQGNVVEKGGLHEALKDVEVDYIPPKKKALNTLKPTRTNPDTRTSLSPFEMSPPEIDDLDDEEDEDEIAWQHSRRSMGF